MDNPVDPGAWRKTKISRTDQLPEDIIMDILLRLPVKSLVRFRCVCKSWHSLLTSSDFSAVHLQHSRRHFYLIGVDESVELIYAESLPLTVQWDKPIYKFALVPDDDLSRWVHIEHPKPQISSMGNHQINHLRVFGSINGLFCISVDFGTYIMIWNPATRQSYQLPSPGLPGSLCTLGFGCSLDNGYAVVRIVINGSSYSNEAEVYDSYSNLWKKTADPPDLWLSRDGCVIANGMPYWWSYCHTIIWFDPSHDTFGTMEFRVVEFDDNRVAGLGVIGGALVVLVLKLDEDDEIEALDIWMMDQPHGDVPISWTKQFRVELVPEVYRWLTCWKGGELVFETSEDLLEDRELCLYDYLRDETQTVPRIGSGLRAPDKIYLYKESLISPHPPCRI